MTKMAKKCSTDQSCIRKEVTSYKIHTLVVTSSFVFYVITLDTIGVQTRSAPQNDRLNLSFVKDVYGGKLARNGQKITIYIS
jgi:hypothetical protein